MGIRRETVTTLMDEGEIGYIEIKKRKIISHRELVRFQTEKTVRRKEVEAEKVITSSEVLDFFQKPKKREIDSFNSKEFLENIIRNNNNGNS